MDTRQGVRAKPGALSQSLAHYLDATIFFSLLVTIALTAIPYGTVEPWWIAAFECVIFFIAILAIIDTWLSKKWTLNGPNDKSNLPERRIQMSFSESWTRSGLLLFAPL